MMSCENTLPKGSKDIKTGKTTQRRGLYSPCGRTEVSRNRIRSTTAAWSFLTLWSGFRIDGKQWGIQKRASYTYACPM